MKQTISYKLTQDSDNNTTNNTSVTKVTNKEAEIQLNQTKGLDGIFNVSDILTEEQRQELKTLKGLLETTIGIFNTTLLTFGQNRSVCELQSRTILKQANSSYQFHKNNKGYFNTLNFVN